MIAARAAKQNHIPFRNSTLTFLLQDSLSQDSKTLMIVCTSPILANAEETFCSLNFASRVRTVELGKVTKNVSAAGVGGGAGGAGASGMAMGAAGGGGLKGGGAGAGTGAGAVGGGASASVSSRRTSSSGANGSAAGPGGAR